MNRIKESFDSLPTAVCFFDSHGVVRLINHQMLKLVTQLRKNSIQTLPELLSSLEDPPASVCCLNRQLQIYHFPDNRDIQFSIEPIQIYDGSRYTQVTATDVTKLIEKQRQLKEENKKLEDANERLRRLFDQMPEIIREEETLEMKLRVHDDIGHSILAARRALIKRANLKEIRESAKLWEESIAVLYRSNQIKEEADPLETALRRAGEMGVCVLFRGKEPKDPKIRALTALAIHECASNCIRHAGGTRLYVRFQEIKQRTVICLTNNGALPKGGIREGGGLSMLRHRTEEIAGTMEVSGFPRFKLLLSLPQKEEELHESNDR